MARDVVKSSRVLAEAEAEADVPYEETRLAKRAPAARRRLAALLAIGALCALIETVAAWSVGWLLASIAFASCAWGAKQGRLGGIIAGALAAVMAVLLPLRLAFLAPHDAATWIAMAVSGLLGLAAAPDIVLLLRDAELQHAYGRWARRSETE